MNTSSKDQSSVVLKRQALFVLLSEDAKKRPHQPNYQRIADEVSPDLARRLRAVTEAQRELDQFVLAETETGYSR